MSNGPTGHELLSWDMTKTKPLAEHGQGHTEAGRGAAPNDHPLTVGLRSGVGQFLLRHPSLSRRLAAPIEEEYVVGLDLHPGSIRSSLLLCGYSVRWPVQELDLPGDDLGAVVLDALVLFVVPATRLEPPLDVDEGTFLEELIAELRKALPYYNAMPLGLLHALAVAVFPGPVSGDAEGCHCLASLGELGLGIRSKPAYDDGFVNHDSSFPFRMIY